jgi:hypothetical protein
VSEGRFDRPGYAARVATISADAALLLAAVETTLLLAGTPGARRGLVALLLFAAASGATGLVALALAALAALRLPASRPARLALGLVGLAVLALALRFDAAAYVRLYGLQHAALGLAAVAGAVAARVALGVSGRGARGRAVGLVLAVVSAPLAMNARHDARAYAAHRGVLLADAFWATHRDVDALPPLPRLPPAPPTNAAPLAQRPRLVLLVTVDALRADAAEAPAFRAFAAVRENAVRFPDARAPAAWTVPSAYALLTGRGPWRTVWTRTMFVGDRPVPYAGASRNPRRVWPLPMRDTARTLAEALHAHGYQGRVCTTLPFQVPGGGLVRGFDVVEQGVYRARNLDLRGTTSDMLTACGLAMLDAAAGAPLFLWLHYSDPHEPYALHPGVPTLDASPAARYAGEVAFVDRHLQGLLVNVHRRVGLGNTLLVLTADHGEEFGEHGGEFHAVTLYDEVMRVPLMIAAPGIKPRVVPGAVSLLDVAPTVLELVGAPPLPGAEGRSLAPAMRGEALTPRPVFAESMRYGRAVRAVVDGRYKLIYEARARTYELYDLVTDPREEVVVTDAHPDVAARLSAMLGVPAP